MIIHFSVPSLIFPFCYPLALVIVRNQSDFPCKDISTAKNTYEPLPSPHLFLDIHGYQPYAQPLSGNSTPLIYS